MAIFDLEERTLIFSKNIIDLIRNTKPTRHNVETCKQLMRSGTSVGANYREANETETPKDFKNRIRIAKKEAKETIYWLELLKYTKNESKISELINEAEELMKILASIFDKWKVNK